MTAFGLWDRFHPHVTIGTLSTAGQRRATLLAVAVGGRVPAWVRLACEARLPVGRTMGGLR